jgi:hypothetical protein
MNVNLHVHTQGIVHNGQIWDGQNAELNTLIVRGNYRSINNRPILIINFKLADTVPGGDPSSMVYDYIRAFFPNTTDLVYKTITFGFEPTSTYSISSQTRRIERELGIALK